jgi:hypothetical protein
LVYVKAARSCVPLQTSQFSRPGGALLLQGRLGCGHACQRSNGLVKLG